jgi:proteic killer suppression protein
MIKSFADKETENLYITGKSKKLPTSIHKTGIRKLDYLQAAKTLDDLSKPPGNKLEKLKGKYEGFYSIRVNDQWRVVFRFDEMNAHDVKITDYH